MLKKRHKTLVGQSLIVSSRSVENTFKLSSRRNISGFAECFLLLQFKLKRLVSDKLIFLCAEWCRIQFKVQFPGQPHAYSSLYTKDPLRGYNMYLGSPEPVGSRVDPGFGALIFDRGQTYKGYQIFPSTVCDVKSKTTEISTVDEFKKFSSERTSFSGNFAYFGIQVGGSSSNSRSETISGKKMTEQVRNSRLKIYSFP